MDPGIGAAIGVGGMTGLYAILKIVKRLMGFKSCKYHSNSNNDECIFGCKATRRPQRQNITEEESKAYVEDEMKEAESIVSL